MAAFSYHHTSFLVDSVFLQNPPTTLKNMSGFIEEGLAQFYPPSTVNGITINDVNNKVVEGSQVDQSSKVGTSDNETCVTKKVGTSTDSSSVVDKLESGEQVTQKLNTFNKKRKNTTSTASLNSSGSKDVSKKQKKNKSEVNEEKNDPMRRPTEEPPVGYIRVRARRGQATDSHSLAERARREKISERMKTLQHLVPGCDKVTGKALMLEEIINYVQSLQNQVEFLSMKLASVNPCFYEFGLDPDVFMIRPERLSSIESLQPTMQHCNPTSPTTFFDANTATAAAATVNTTTIFGTPNNQPLIDSSLVLLLQGQRPIDFIQDPAVLVWDLEEQRQKFLNPSCFGNNLSSFH